MQLGAVGAPMSQGRLDFHLEAQAMGSRARAAIFRTGHNEVRTPLFMPVGTQATVKGQLTQSLEDAGSQILLANTYHLLLRPGPEVFRRMGGIHSFMSWKQSVLTDSGGFQIFSLPHSRAMTEEGATFQSYIDGRTILLSPERSIEMQKAIGSDIMMVLDQCIASTADEATARAAVGITHRRPAAWRHAAIRRRRFLRSCKGRSSPSCGAKVPPVSAKCRLMDLRSVAWPSGRVAASARIPASSPPNFCRPIGRAT